MIAESKELSQYGYNPHRFAVRNQASAEVLKLRRQITNLSEVIARNNLQLQQKGRPLSAPKQLKSIAASERNKVC